ncbi:MAG: reverse transcriptase-like protein [Lachnospiraceae bacterium]|jgi:ribonuclease HI|nr:reverse transcriptase-like protein [Lachnospiraceae bacterium]
MSEKKLTAYVDGSFNPTVNRYAYGCVLIYEDEVIEELCGSGCDPEALKQRNVSGEMIASMLSVQYALKNGFNSLDIYYDYSGIECWVTGAWKAKNELTKSYRDWMNDKRKKLDIRFYKVEAHSNVKYNEQADKLAKRGLEKEPGLPSV